jgi:hypothetical protein
MLIELEDHLPELLANIEQLTKSELFVGIPEDSLRDTDITNSALGYIHEFGSPANNIPARPFLYPGIEKATDSNIKLLIDALDDLYSLEPVDIDYVLMQVGDNTVGYIQSAIDKQDLIDTGQLRESITYELRSAS